MTNQTLSLKTIREQAKFGVILASAWVLTACSGYGTTGGGLQVNSNSMLSSGGEFSNGSTSTPVVVQPESNGGVVVTPVSVSAPATEAEAFDAIRAAHSDGIRGLVLMAGQQALAAFDDVSPEGAPAPASSPYGGPVTPPSPPNPIDDPPTGVDNPDDLPVLDSSSAKKSAVSRRGAELIRASAANIRGLAAFGKQAEEAQRIAGYIQNLQALNLTNLSAETQSMVQGNILMLQALLEAVQ